MIHAATNFTAPGFYGAPGKRISDLASLVVWASAQSDFVNVTSTSIDKFNDRGGGAAYFSSTLTQRPTLAASQFGALSGATFDGVNDISALTGTWDRSAPWSIATVMKGSVGSILASFQGAGLLTALLIQTNVISISHGNGFLNLPYTYNTPVLVIASSDGETLSLRIGQAAAVPVKTDNAGGLAGVYMGALNGGGAGQFSGAIGEVMIFSQDILDPANFDTLQVVFDYVRALYPSVPVPAV